MRKYALFLVICLISIFSFNMSSKALTTTCANYLDSNEKYFFIWNEQEIEINEELLGSNKWTLFTTQMSLINDISWYVFENNSNGEVMLLLTDYYVYGLNSYTYAIRYVQTSEINKHFFKFIFKNGVLKSSDIYTNTSLIIEDYGSSRSGRIINSSSGSFDVTTPSYEYKTVTFEESATCSYAPTTIQEPTFQANYTQYDDVNAAVNLTINFKDFDLEKYDYFLSFDEGKSYKNINSYIDSEANYILTRLENFNVVAKVVDKSSEAFITSSYYEDSITSIEDFIVFYEDTTKNEYVTVDNKEYLFSKTIRIYPRFTVPNLQYRVSLDGGETYTYFYDLYEKKVFKDTSFLIEVVDSNYDTITTKNFVTRGFEETEEIGSQLIFYENDDPEDYTKRIVSLRVLNINPNYLYFVQSGNSAYNKVFPIHWENGTYYFNSTDQIMSYCARITDSDLNVIKEECYIPKSLSETQFFSMYVNKFIRFIDARTLQIMKISDTIDYAYNKIPEDYQSFLEFAYLIACFAAIIWNLRK